MLNDPCHSVHYRGSVLKPGTQGGPLQDAQDHSVNKVWWPSMAYLVFSVYRGALSYVTWSEPKYWLCPAAKAYHQTGCQSFRWPLILQVRLPGT